MNITGKKRKLFFFVYDIGIMTCLFINIVAVKTQIDVSKYLLLLRAK
jgi:hypothetical protein